MYEVLPELPVATVILVGVVTDDVPIGFVVDHVILELQLLPPAEIEQLEAEIDPPGFVAQTLPVQVVPLAHDAVALLELSNDPLSYKEKVDVPYEIVLEVPALDEEVENCTPFCLTLGLIGYEIDQATTDVQLLDPADIEQELELIFPEAAAQVLPFHVVPLVHDAVLVDCPSSDPLLYR